MDWEIKYRQDEKANYIKIQPKRILCLKDSIALIDSIPKDMDYTKGLIISGRMPIWAYGILIAYLGHLFPFLAVFDPKLGGAVIVASHTDLYAPGDLFELEPEIFKFLL